MLQCINSNETILESNFQHHQEYMVNVLQKSVQPFLKFSKNALRIKKCDAEKKDCSQDQENTSQQILDGFKT